VVTQGLPSLFTLWIIQISQLRRENLAVWLLADVRVEFRRTDDIAGRRGLFFVTAVRRLVTFTPWSYGYYTMKRLALVYYGLLALGCSPTTTARLRLPPLETVAHVDLQRYQGTWYEISSFPQSFQKGCTATTATYKSRDDGEIDVVNRCRKNSLDGPEKIAQGRARIVDRTTNAKLEVSFFRPFWGDYWVVALGDDYDYAVVGHPSRDYLWILSRTPTMDDELYATIVRRLSLLGYETGRLQRTLQPSNGLPTTFASSAKFVRDPGR